MAIAYLNGLFLDESHAFVPINDRGFLFGDGVFTTIKVEEGSALYLEDHFARLKHDCTELFIEFPSIDFSLIHEIIEKNEAQKGIWRMKIIITGKGELSSSIRPYGVILITIKPYITLSDDPIHLGIYPYPITSKFSHIKSLCYAERFQIKYYAKEQGFDDAIVLSPEGYLLETSFSNIFWIEKGHFCTPHQDLPLLRGITLKQIMKETNLKVNEKKYRLEDIGKDATIYICNALTGIRSIKSILDHQYTVLSLKKGNL